MERRKCAEAIFKGITGVSSASNEWIKNDIGWGTSTQMVPIQELWEKIEGTWYYFNENGYVVSGWQFINDHWYYLNENMMVLWSNENRLAVY